MEAAAFVPTGSVSERASDEDDSTFVKDGHNRRCRLESLFCYDNAIPEEIIDKPVGLSVAEKVIGNNPRREDCWQKVVVELPTYCAQNVVEEVISESNRD